MSEENLGKVRAIIEAFNRRDLPAFLRWAAPDVEWHPVTVQAEGGSGFRGHDGMREWWANIDAAFAELEMELSDARDLGDDVAFLGGFEAGFEAVCPWTANSATTLVSVMAS